MVASDRWGKMMQRRSEMPEPERRKEICYQKTMCTCSRCPSYIQARKRFYSVASERVTRSPRKMVVSVEPAPLWNVWASPDSITAPEEMKPSNEKPSYWSWDRRGYKESNL